MLKLNTRVNHTGHGLGTIVAYNGQGANAYAEGNLSGEVVKMAVSVGLGTAIVSSFYDGARYPYVVKFDSGYKDVYALDDVTKVFPSEPETDPK